MHNKFVVESDVHGNASRVLTGSTNWTTTGLCTQLNNVLIVADAVVAIRYLDQWGKLVAAGDDLPASLKTSNSKPTTDNNITLYFAATNGEAEFKPVLDLIAGAREGALFLMFMPGQSPLLSALLDRVQKNDIYVRGVVSSVTPSANGTITKVGGEVVKSGAPAQSFHDDVPLPSGIRENDNPSWAETEFNVQEMLAAHLMAIVHSKAIVIDPFSDQCAVITGSHNFSDSASQKNDENLVIIRGNKKLARAYALHINGVYDHYSWRAFLGSGGNPDQIFKPLDGWKLGGSRAQELDFWMEGPVSPQSAQQGTSSAASKNKAGSPAKSKAGKTPKKSKASQKRKRRPRRRPRSRPRNQRPVERKKGRACQPGQGAKQIEEDRAGGAKESQTKTGAGPVGLRAGSECRLPVLTSVSSAPPRLFSPGLAGSPLYRFTGASRRAALCITDSTSAGSTPFLSAASASRADLGWARSTTGCCEGL